MRRVSISGAQPNARTEAAALREEARSLRVAGNHAKAISMLDAAAAAATRAGDTLLAAQVRIGAIDSLGWLGRVEEALGLASYLETELVRLGAESDAAKVLVNRGNLAFRQDEYAGALQCYERAGDMLERAGEEVAVARVHANRANVLTHLGRMDESIALYRDAGNIFAANGMDLEVAMGEGNRAFLEYLSGRLTVALSGFRRARQSFELRGQDIEAAKADLDMGDVYRVLNLFPEALESYGAAIAVFDQRGLPYERAKAEMGRGAVLAASGSMEAAFAALAEADRLFGAQGNRLQQAHVGLIRAGMLYQAGEAEEARTEAHAAERAFRRAKLLGWAAEARFLTVRIDMDKVHAGDTDPLRKMRSIARAGRMYARGWLECRAHEAIARWHVTHGQASQAIRRYRRGIDALESLRTQVVPEEMHVTFLRDKLGAYDGLIGLLLERGSPSDARDALNLVERGRSRLLLDRLEAAMEPSAEGTAAPLSPFDQDLRARISQLRAELNRAYHEVHIFDERAPRRRPGGESAGSQRLLALECEYGRALREWDLAAGNTERRASGPGNIGSLHAALGSTETLVEYYVGPEAVSAFLVTRERARLFSGIASTADVSHAARRLRYHLQRFALASPTQHHVGVLCAGAAEVTARLYELLWRPLESGIETEQVTIVPHSLLHGLPFHAFGPSCRAVLDRHEVVYAPSAEFRSRQRNEANRPEGTALLIGVPSHGIEHVSSEIDALEALLPNARSRCGEDATLDAFRTDAPACSTLHLATHALYRADNPLFSGLRFADGWLLARDLYDIRLDCHLATLSACQTGVSQVLPGDELFGLLRGFLAAGARSVATSLWPADDAATANLMTRFYTGIAGGRSKAASLRIAQREMREESPHPYHWAAFTLTGGR